MNKFFVKKLPSLTAGQNGVKFKNVITKKLNTSIVAVAGLEPATCFRFARNPLLPTELHDKPYIFIRSEAHAGAQPCLRYLVIRSWTYSEPSLHLFVLLNTPLLPWLIRPTH